MSTMTDNRKRMQGHLDSLIERAESTDPDWALMTDEDLIRAYNEDPSTSNPYGMELLRRIHACDRSEFGMSADSLRGERR